MQNVKIRAENKNTYIEYLRKSFQENGLILLTRIKLEKVERRREECKERFERDRKR